MPFVLYNAALGLFSPAIAVWLLYRLFLKGKSREGLSQRLGNAPRLPPPARKRIWIHAVSAGEMAAAAPVAGALRRLAPEHELVVSTITPAGLAQARRLVPDAREVFYFPFDFGACVSRALGRVRPSMVVVVETELWPNFFREAARRRVPVAVVNGRVSDRSMRRLAGPARLLRPLYRATLGLVARFALQTPEDRERAVALGADPARARVCGSTKFDQQIRRLAPAEANGLRRAFGLHPEQPLWIAGSTHPGEEEQILTAWESARETVPDLALMLAPRHIERADAVEALCLARARDRSEPYRIVRRSRLAAIDVVEGENESAGSRGPLVILLDTVGELAAFYGLASVVFVGGSLVPVGGHDILQPLFHGKPTFFGPHMHNQRDLAAVALRAGAAAQVSGPEALTAVIRDLLTSPSQAAAFERAAAALLAAHQGAADRCAEMILEVLKGGSMLAALALLALGSW